MTPGQNVWYYCGGSGDIHQGTIIGREKRTGRAQPHYLIRTARRVVSVAESLIRRGMIIHCQRQHERCMAEVMDNQHNEIGALIGAADWKNEAKLWER